MPSRNSLAGEERRPRQSWSRTGGVQFRFRQRLLRATVLVGELRQSELCVSFKRPVQKVLHQVEGEAGSCRVHLKARLDLWRLHRSCRLLTWTFKPSAAPPCDWHLHKCYRDYIQMRLGFEMNQLNLTWFNRDILLQLPSVRCGVCLGKSRSQESTNCYWAQAWSSFFIHKFSSSSPAALYTRGRYTAVIFSGLTRT